MKDYNNNKCPVKTEEFSWIAEYNKEDKYKRLYLSEYEFKNGGFGHVNHSFDTIEDDKLDYLGYLGHGYKFFYNIKNGVFNAYNTDLKVTYFDIIGNKEYEFMNESYGPFKGKGTMILYKTKATEIDQSGNQRTFTVEYGFGYKKKINDFNIEALFHIPTEVEEPTEDNPNPENKPNFFTFKIMSPYNIHGQLRFYFNNKMVATINKDLRGDFKETFKVNIN